jgi:hypothetical protein
MIWIAVLIPIVGAFIMLRWYRDHLAWWEIIIPMVVSLIFVLIFKFAVEKSQTSDTEYRGALVTEARYYESWTSYVRKTCSRTTRVGKTSITTYYDCSYCDENPANWTVVDSRGNEFDISEDYYQQLTRRWKSSPAFVELGRNIDYGGFDCGKDGDMYAIKWNGRPITSEATVTSHDYENRVQAAHTVFDFPEVTDDDKKMYHLVDYPEIENYKQNTVLGDTLKWMTPIERKMGEKLIQHSCGYWGPRKHANIWLIFFVDKPTMAATMQEAYWGGGNDNEITICIGLDSKSKNIQWVKPFSWTPNRTLLVDLREDIMNTKKFNFVKIKEAIDKNMPKYVKKDFKEFSYITVDPPTWAIVTTFLVTILTTAGLCWWAVANDYVADRDNVWKTITRWAHWR